MESVDQSKKMEIEEYTSKIDKLFNSINDVKNNDEMPEDEKKKKYDDLNSQMDEIKEQIISKINEGEYSDAEQDSLKNILSSIEQYREELREELNDLSSSINPTVPSESPESSVAPQPDVEGEKKGFFAGIKDWFSERAEDCQSREKFNEHPWQNYGLAASVVGLGFLGYWWIKKRKKKKEKEKAQNENNGTEGSESKSKEKEKKPFWNRWYGKLIKYSGIGTGIYYVAHGLKTGKWDFSHLFDWNNSGPTSSAEENFDDYTEFSKENPEKYREYEKIGENINLMYDKIRDTERNYFGADSQIVLGLIGDKAKEEKIKKTESFKDIETRGLVPYSLDNFYNNVGDMISYGGVNRYIRSKNIEEYKQKIKSFGAEWFDKLMVPFLSTLVNVSSFGFVSTDSAQQKMDKYFKGISDNSGDNLVILDLFFRQYTKVLTYMADKKNALASKIAREILSTQGYNGKTWPSDPEEQEEMIHKAINDSEWVDENLKTTKYGEFLSSSILGASRILEEEGLNNTEMTGELNDVVNEMDEQTSDLLGGFDDNAFVKAEEKLNGGGSLDTDEKNELKKVADKTIEDLGPYKDGGWLYNTFDYCFELFGFKEEDKQTILKESGISKALNETVNSIQSIKSEIISNPTRENVDKLKKLVGEYTSMKKEVAVAIYAINEAKENKSPSDVVNYIVPQVLSALGTGFGHFVGSVNDLIHGRGDLKEIGGDIINTFIGLTISGGLVQFGGRLSGIRLMMKAGYYTKTAGLGPVRLAELGIRRTGRTGWALKYRINDLATVKPVKAENLLKRKILDGALSEKQVCSIVQRNDKMKISFNLTGYQNNDRIFKEVVYNIFGKDKELEADLFIKYYGKVRGLVEYSRDIGNGGIKDGKFLFKTSEKGFKALREFDIEFSKFGDTVQKSYFEHMIKKVRGTEDMQLLRELIYDDEFKNIIDMDNINKLKKINLKQLRYLQNNGLLDKLKSGQITIDEMLNKLKNVPKSAIKATEALSDTRRSFNKCIDKAIKSLEEWSNRELAEIHIEKLKALKNDASLVDEEMEGFIKFIDQGFDATLIPDLKRLFSITDEAGDLGKVGERLKQLFDEGNYSEFKALLKREELGDIFRRSNIAVEKILTNFDGILGKLGKIGIVSVEAVTPLIKSFAKILSKLI